MEKTVELITIYVIVYHCQPELNNREQSLLIDFTCELQHWIIFNN